MKRLFNPCCRYRQNLCLLAGGVLPGPESAQIKNHLAACTDCRKYYEEIKTVAMPLTNWAGNFAHLQPGPTVQNRWARAIQAAGKPEPARRVTPAMAFREWWQDVIWPCRRLWTGLAAVWVVIFAGNFSLHDHSQTIAMKSSPPSQAMIASFKDQQKVLAELLADYSTPRAAERQKFFSPKPRTENETILTT
jgi:anti-sigma factor RsiW